MHSPPNPERDSPSIHVFSGSGWPIKPTGHFASADRFRLGVAQGLLRRQQEERRRLRRNSAKAKRGPAALAMLVVRAVVGVTDHGCGPMMRVDRHLGSIVAVLMPILAVLVVVAVLIILCMFTGVMGLVSALSH